MPDVMVLGAGGPAGFNVCKAASEAGHEVFGIDAKKGLLPLVEPYAQTVQLKTWKEIETLANGLDDPVVLAQPDSMLLQLASSGLRTFLPDKETLRICQDKSLAGDIWSLTNLKTGTVQIEEPFPDYLHTAADAFGLPYWLRAQSGAGAKGATLVTDLRVGYHWLSYWKYRGVTGFIAEEYLPGREFCFTGLLDHGRLIGGFSRERLEWIYPHLTPSGRTGTPAISEVVYDERVFRVACDAIVAIDSEPTGVFCVDMVEDDSGWPVPTEINAGRWATTSPLYSALGPNLVDLQIRLALGEEVIPLGKDIYPMGSKLLRHIDMNTRFIR